MKSLDEVYELAQAFGGIPVLRCTPDSPADRAGIRYGDIVVAVNGHPTPDLAAYVEAQDTPSLRVPVTVIRDGHPVELVLVHQRPPMVVAAAGEEHAHDMRILRHHAREIAQA